MVIRICAFKQKKEKHKESSVFLVHLIIPWLDNKGYAKFWYNLEEYRSYFFLLTAIRCQSSKVAFRQHLCWKQKKINYPMITKNSFNNKSFIKKAILIISFLKPVNCLAFSLFKSRETRKLTSILLKWLVSIWPLS